MELVAEYQGKITPDFFSDILYNAGKEYGDCMIVVENNTVGFAVLEKLKERRYPNVYHSIKSTHEYVEEYIAEHMTSAVAGFTTSGKTKPLIIAKMEEFLRNKIIIINSSRLFNELKTFIWHHGKATAQRSYNDDLIMACAIGCWVRDTVLVENKRDTEYTKAALGAIMSANKTFNSSIEGMREYKHIKKQQQIKQAKDFVWLFKG
jgi:hypothetical protein